MSLWRQLTYGLRSLTNRAKHDRETAEEVEQYFEEAEAAWRSRGLSARTPGGPPGSKAAV